MTAWLKIVAWRHAKTRPTGDRGWGAGVCVCVGVFVLRIKVPTLPVKNDITPTGGRLAEVSNIATQTQLTHLCFLPAVSEGA